MVLDARLQAHAYPTHASPTSQYKPPSSEHATASLHPAPPIVSQDAAPSPPGTKYPPAGAGEQYHNVPPHPLAGMFTSQAGGPNTIDGGEDDPTVDNWEGRTSSESKAD